MCSQVHGDGRVCVSAQGMLRSLLNYDSELVEQRGCLGFVCMCVCTSEYVRMRACVCVHGRVCVGSSSKQVRGY